MCPWPLFSYIELYELWCRERSVCDKIYASMYSIEWMFTKYHRHRNLHSSWRIFWRYVYTIFLCVHRNETRVFRLTGCIRVSHEGLKLSKKCFHKNCLVRKKTWYMQFFSISERNFKMKIYISIIDYYILKFYWQRNDL